MKTGKLEIMTVTYKISGDLLNGGAWVDKKFIPNIEKETIYRKIKRIDIEKGILICECDRKFLLNKNLSVTK